MEPRDMALMRRYQSDPTFESYGTDGLECHSRIVDDPERTWSGATRLSPLEFDFSWLSVRVGSLMVLAGKRLVHTGYGLRNVNRAA